ncbi:MAG: pilus assembly protein PilM [Lachnospiraceae bacterium]|nr:pilus assembly protein PilM [Lachnospiraceae bacterium]
MAQRLLSITLGTTSAKLAEIMQAGKKIQVFSAYDIPISEGLLDDGFILDVDSLAEELKGFISKYKIKTKKIAFSIASKRIASKEVIIPFVKEKQIQGLLNMNAADYFPVGNIEDYAINYSIIETVKNAENTQYRLNVIATPGELLDGYTALAKAMKCSVEIVDFAGNAILQILKTQAHSGEINAILQLGYENTVINIMNGNVQIMQRTVATGYNALISTVAEAVGLDEEDATAFLEDNDITRICSAYPDVKYVCDSLVSSIGRIFEFYNGRSADHPITGVMFIGDATDINGIGESLSEGLGIEAQEIYTLSNVQVKTKQITPEFATNFMANIGVVLAPMNLKYERKGEEEKAKEEGKLPWGLVVISVIAAVALGVTSTVLYHMAKTERDELKIKLDALSEIQSLEDQLSEAQAKNQVIQNFLASTKGPNDSLMRLITDLEKIMPSGMSIDTFSLADGSVTLSAGGHGKASVARFIEEIKALKYVESVTVDYVSEVNEGMDKYDVFNMTFSLLDVNEIEAAESNENSAEENSGEEANTDADNNVGGDE